MGFCGASSRARATDTAEAAAPVPAITPPVVVPLAVVPPAVAPASVAAAAAAASPKQPSAPNMDFMSLLSEARVA